MINLATISEASGHNIRHMVVNEIKKPPEKDFFSQQLERLRPKLMEVFETYRKNPDSFLPVALWSFKTLFEDPQTTGQESYQILGRDITSDKAILSSEDVWYWVYAQQLVDPLFVKVPITAVKLKVLGLFDRYDARPELATAATYSRILSGARALYPHDIDLLNRLTDEAKDRLAAHLSPDTEFSQSLVAAADFRVLFPGDTREVWDPSRDKELFDTVDDMLDQYSHETRVTRGMLRLLAIRKTLNATATTIDENGLHYSYPEENSQDSYNTPALSLPLPMRKLLP